MYVKVFIYIYIYIYIYMYIFHREYIYNVKSDGSEKRIPNPVKHREIVLCEFANILKIFIFVKSSILDY